MLMPYSQTFQKTPILLAFIEGNANCPPIRPPRAFGIICLSSGTDSSGGSHAMRDRNSSEPGWPSIAMAYSRSIMANFADVGPDPCRLAGIACRPHLVTVLDEGLRQR